MAEPAPATENNEARRVQMLRAAAELVCERGFSETRISDVAKRAGVSSALVIYYFGTRDRLLVDALRPLLEVLLELLEQVEDAGLHAEPHGEEEADAAGGGQQLSASGG